MKLTRIQKPRGHKEERASFPDQFHTRVSKIHIPKILTIERKEEGGEGGDAWERRGGCFWTPGEEQEREWVRGYLCPLTLGLKD